jgi:hypothetical protein
MDFVDLQEFKAEGLELGEDAVERCGIRQQAGKHGLGALLMGYERRERRQQGGTEVAADPELVQDGVITHESMVGTRQVNRRRRDPVIVMLSGTAR